MQARASALHALRGGNTGVLTGVSGHFSRFSLFRRTTSARNSAPLLTLILGSEVDFVDRLAAGVIGVLSAESEPGGDRLCDRLGLGSCVEDEGEGSGAEEAANALNEDWERDFELVADVFAAAAGVCDDAMHESDFDFCNAAGFAGA